MGVLHKVHTLVEDNVMKREAIEMRYLNEDRVLHAIYSFCKFLQTII